MISQLTEKAREIQALLNERHSLFIKADSITCSFLNQNVRFDL